MLIVETPSRPTNFVLIAAVLLAVPTFSRTVSANEHVTYAHRLPRAGVDHAGYLVLNGTRASSYGTGFSVVNGHVVTPYGNVISEVTRKGN